MSNKQTAVALMRSTKINENQQSESIASQYAAIAAYAKKLEVEVKKTFESSAKDPKTTLWEILSYCEANPDIKYLLVSDVSRLSRSFADYTSYKAIFAKYGVSIWPATKSDFDFDTPIGHFMETLSRGLGMFENSMRSEMTKAGMLRRVEQGYAVQQPPYGYSKTETPGLFKVNICGEILGQELRELAKGTTTIEDTATKLGLTIPLDSDPKPFSVTKLKRLASNPYYAGFISFQGILYKGRHVPILTPDEQQRLIGMFGQ